MDNNNWRPTPPGGEPNMETPDQLMGQSNAANMLPGQQQLMSQIQSLPAHLQQQPNALQRDMQQRLQASSQASGSVLQPQNVVDQQKQLYQSQRALPETSSTSLDSTAGQSNGGDWQEEVYQKIKVMKEMYFPELNEMYQKIATKLQQHDSLPQQPKSEQLEKLKIFRNMLERIIGFLQVSKINVQPSHKEKLGSYEKQTVNVINTNRLRKPSMQQGKLPPPHMHSMQQPSQVQLGLQQQPNALQRDMQQRLQASRKFDMSDRRIWTAEEEDVMINILEGIVVEGGRCDTGSFRSGTYEHVASKMREKIKDIHITTKHVQNKMKRLKDKYSAAYDMLNTSGFGWNDTLKCVVVDNTEILDAYVKKHPNKNYKANTPFPFYERLTIVFGKDRATGSMAESAADTLDHMGLEHEESDTAGFTQPLSTPSNVASGSSDPNAGETSHRKRKRNVSSTAADI